MKKNVLSKNKRKKINKIISGKKIKHSYKIYKLIKKEYKRNGVKLKNNIVFRTAFESLYGKRGLKLDDLDKIYDIFDCYRKMNNKGIKFCYKDVANDLEKILKRRQDVYASKICHTICPSKYGIKDSKVVEQLRKRKIVCSKDYDKWNETYKKFVETNPEADYIIEKFNEKVGQIPKIKAVDFVLWLW